MTVQLQTFVAHMREFDKFSRRIYPLRVNGLLVETFRARYDDEHKEILVEFDAPDPEKFAEPSDIEATPEPIKDLDGSEPVKDIVQPVHPEVGSPDPEVVPLTTGDDEIINIDDEGAVTVVKRDDPLAPLSHEPS